MRESFFCFFLLCFFFSLPPPFEIERTTTPPSVTCNLLSFLCLLPIFNEREGWRVTAGEEEEKEEEEEKARPSKEKKTLLINHKERKRKEKKVWPFFLLDAFRSPRLCSETQNPAAHPQAGASSETFVPAREF